MKHIFLTITFCFFAYIAYSQVGINTINPDSTAALHIEGNGTKGLLIPIMKRSGELGGGREILKPTRGLIVCDTAEYAIPMFYVYDGDKWIAMNPLQASEDSLSKLSLSYSKNKTITFANNVVVVGKSILKDSVEINDVLTIKGKTTLQESVEINNIMTVNGAINAKNNTINAGTIKVGANTEITPDKVKATMLEGFGVTPIGGIIMWSGTTIPDGWALCDGSITSNGYTTPDLRGRFIVGYGNTGNGLPDNVWDDYTNSGNLSSKGTDKGSTGGEIKHTLTIQEMPKHRHSSGADNNASFVHASGRATVDSGDTTRGLDENSRRYADYTAYEGGGLSHENRPPYYVLAFIMRVE